MSHRLWESRALWGQDSRISSDRMMGTVFLMVEEGTSVERVPGGRAAPTRQRALWVTSLFTVFSQRRYHRVSA